MPRPHRRRARERRSLLDRKPCGPRETSGEPTMPAESADEVRWRIQHQQQDPAAFRAALLNVAPTARDAWVDRVLGLHDLPADGPDLPRGCVPYFPSSV